MTSDNDDVDLDTDLLGLLVKLFFYKFIETFISNPPKIKIERPRFEDDLERKVMKLPLFTKIFQENNLLIIKGQDLMLNKKQMASSAPKDQSGS